MTLDPDHLYRGNGSEPCQACGKGLASHEKHRWYKKGLWLHARSIDLCEICGDPPDSLRHNKSRFFNGHEFVDGGGLLNPDPPCHVCAVRYSQHSTSDFGRYGPTARLVGGDLTATNNDSTTWTNRAQGDKETSSGPSLSESRKDRLKRLGGKFEGGD